MREVGAIPTVPCRIRCSHHPQLKTRMPTPQRGGGCATNHCCRTRLRDARPRPPRTPMGIEPRRPGGVLSAFLVISHRNAEGTGVVGRVASRPGRRRTRHIRSRTPTRCSHERAPERDACTERKEPEADEGRTYDLSSPSHVLAARGPCARGTAWPPFPLGTP